MLWLGMPATLTSKEVLRTSMAKSTSCCRQVLPRLSCMFAALSTKCFCMLWGRCCTRGGKNCCCLPSPAPGAQHSPAFGCQICSNANSSHGAASIRLLCLSAHVTSSCNILISAFTASSCLLLHYQCCNTLLHCCVQAYVSRARVESFSLIADMMYVSSNAPRIARSVFEICLRRGWSSCAELALTLCKVCL